MASELAKEGMSHPSPPICTWRPGGSASGDGPAADPLPHRRLEVDRPESRSPIPIRRHVIDGFLEQQGIVSGYNDTALTDPGDDSYWPLSWGRGVGSHCCVVPACAAACSAVTSANWSGWGWNDTCAFALLLVDLAVLIEHSSWGPRRL